MVALTVVLPNLKKGAGSYSAVDGGFAPALVLL
jgi:hypothetical protein